MPTRQVSFAGKTIAVSWTGVDAGKVVDFLYRDTESRPMEERAATFSVVSESPDDMTVQCDGVPVVDAQPAGIAGLALLSESLYRLIAASDAGLALHAGAVAVNGHAVLFPGGSGSGKTSVIGWLLSRGYGYLSDEAVFFGPDDVVVHPFTRPLNVKAPTRDWIAKRFDRAEELRAAESSLYGHRSLDGNSTPRPLPLGMIVFPRFRLGSDLSITPLTKAQCGARLMGCHVNARNLDGHGFHLIATVARRVPAYGLEYGAFAQLEGVLDTLIDSTGSRPVSAARVHELARAVRVPALATPSAATSIRAAAAPTAEFPAPTPVGPRRKLTIGMAVYDDYDGVYFTAQAIRMYHPEVTAETEILVIDNHPDGPSAAATKGLDHWIDAYRYVPNAEFRGTAVRDFVFREASSDYVLCVDCHVLLAPGALRKLIDYLDANPDCMDLLQGPMLYDDVKRMSTHLDPQWREGFYGTWAFDARGGDPDAAPFDIFMQGLGLFACRRDAWLGFNSAFRGFGGEEGYIHEKFRRAGRRTLCLPSLRWLHRFGRPQGVPYPIRWEDRIRNYLIGFSELGLDTTPIEKHFREHIGAGPTAAIFDRMRAEMPFLNQSSASQQS